MIAYGLCFIWQPSFVKNYSAFCSRHSFYVFFKQFLSRIENKFKPPRSDRGFLFEGFFQKFLHFHYFCHHTAICSFSNWFICFDFGYFFYNKDFFAFCKVFFTSYIARGIIKLIAWTTSFLEERLNLEITWLIWNANNATMPPCWTKNIHLHLKRLLLIQNAWSMNLA